MFTRIRTGDRLDGRCAFRLEVVPIDGRPPAAAPRGAPFGLGSSCGRRAAVRGVSTETAARPRPLRLTSGPYRRHAARPQRQPVAIVNAFTTVNPRPRQPSARSTTRSSVRRLPTSSACIRTTSAMSLAGGASRRRSHRDAGSVWTRVVPEHGTHVVSGPVQGRPRRGASRASWSRHASLDGDRLACEPRSSGPAPVKIPAAPGVLVGSRHNERGSGRRANLRLHPCQPSVRPHSSRPIPGCQSCGLRYALALPKRPRLCKRCGGSNPEDEGGAPEQKRARNAQTIAKSASRRDDPRARLTATRSAASGLASASSAPHWEVPNGDLTWLDQCTGEGRRCSMTSIEIRSEAPARGFQRRERQREVVARVRHDLHRGAAPARRHVQHVARRRSSSQR